VTRASLRIDVASKLGDHRIGELRQRFARGGRDGLGRRCAHRHLHGGATAVAQRRGVARERPPRVEHQGAARRIQREKLDAEIGINAIDTNLKPFFAHGGKLIQYHGWADPLIPPQNSVNYYESVGKALGGLNQVKNNYRLFMVPGMDHCGGGDGPNTFDTLTALEQWVEKGKAPDQILATKAGRTRPLCPYPQVARYGGSGSVDAAASFACADPR